MMEKETQTGFILNSWCDWFCPLLTTIKKILICILISIFWDMMPCRLIYWCHHFGGACCLHVWHSPRRVITLKMEAASSSETLIPIWQSTWHGIPEDCNLKYMKYFSFFHWSFYITWIMTYCWLPHAEYVTFFIQPVTSNYKFLNVSETLV
jgi:hypothetical protein